VPSRRDREQNQYPGVVHLIISFQAAQPLIRAWWLITDANQEAEWVIEASRMDEVAKDASEKPGMTET
jgi:hypothetical protein